MDALQLFDLSGRAALVSGGTRGIGRSMVHGLASAGAGVAIIGRNPASCAALAGDIRREFGVAAIGIGYDVTGWDEAEQVVDRVHAEFGRIDVLVNNAGAPGTLGQLTAADRADWRSVFALNVEAVLRLGTLVAPRMAADGYGSIINIASVAAHVGRPLLGAYAASKAAMINLSKTMAMEWARTGVRVNVISPGAFHTDVLDDAEAASPGYLASKAAGNPLGRVGDPAEIVGTVVYLASSAASFVTGAEIVIDGGHFPPTPLFLESAAAYERR